MSQPQCQYLQLEHALTTELPSPEIPPFTSVMRSLRTLVGCQLSRRDMLAFVGLILAASAVLAVPVCSAGTQTHRPEQPMRGVWVANPDHNRFYYSADTIHQQLLAWKQQGINTVFVAMWNQGRTLYPSAVVKNVTGVAIDSRFSGRDPLQEVIQVAHQEGIKVYAWFEFGFASDYKGGLGSELIAKRPHFSQRRIAQTRGLLWWCLSGHVVEAANE